MALSNLVVKVSYQGDGANTTFAIPYTVIVDDSAETKVYLRDETDPDAITETLQVEGALSDYVLEGAPTSEDFHTDVEFNVAPTVDQIVVIYRELPLTQIMTLIPDGPINRETLTLTLDRIVAMIQQVNNQFTRVPMLSITEQAEQLVMPDPIALQFLRWDEDGENLENADIAEVVAELLAESGALPVGGVTGSLLTKITDADGDADWVQADAIGFSQNYGEAVNLPTLRDVIDYIFDFGYTGPLVSLSASGSGTVREKGDAVTSSTLTATITQQTDPIAEVRFYLNPATLLDTQTSGGGIPSGGNSTYNWTGSFSDNTTFRVDVDDDGTSGGPTTVSSTSTFTFVYPYYVGAGAASLTAAAVSGLTKRIIVESTSRQETITAADTNVLYFAYPASYGVLTSILDVNSFETIGDWTLRVENITGLDLSAVSYNIYEFDNPLAADDYQYTFIQ